jgi:hypothetical protein
MAKSTTPKKKSPSAQKVMPSEWWWAVVRLLLGLAQMTGAAMSLCLLLATGINQWSMEAAVATCLCTATSKILFGRRW